MTPDRSSACRSLGGTAATLLALATVMAAGVTALFAVPAAFAQTKSPVEVSEENGEHCPPVTMSEGQAYGGCHLHLVGDGAGWTVQIGWDPDSVCASEFDVRIDESGHGYIYNPVLTGQDCSMGGCDVDESEGLDEWSLELYERNGELEAEAGLCITIPGVTVWGLPEIPCHLDGIDVDAITHDLIELDVDDIACDDPGYSGIVFHDSHWDSEEGSEGIEITHL